MTAKRPGRCTCPACRRDEEHTRLSVAVYDAERAALAALSEWGQRATLTEIKQYPDLWRAYNGAVRAYVDLAAHERKVDSVGEVARA